jgi:hypothetical protein
MTDQSQMLLRMKKHIDDGKTKAAELRGQIAQLEKQRAEEFGCADDAAAEAYIVELTASIAGLTKELDEGVAAVKEELGW